MIKLNIKDPAIRTLIIETLLDQADNNIDGLIGQGVDPLWIENLRQLSSRDSVRASHFHNVEIEVTVNEKQLVHAFTQVADERRVRHLKEYFVRHGASVTMICKMFKMSSKEAKTAKQLLSSEQRLGRPPMPNPFDRETIHRQWDSITKTSDSLVREHLYTLHQIFPVYTLATLWLVINEFGTSSAQVEKLNTLSVAGKTQQTKWQGGNCVHKIDTASKNRTTIVS